LSSLAKNTLFLTVGKLLGNSLYIVFGLVLPRFVDSDQVGVYTLLGTFGFFGSMLSSFGIPLIVTREVARTPEQTTRIYADARMAMLMGGLFAGGLLFLYMFGESAYTGNELGQLPILVTLVVAMILADAFGTLGEALFQGYERMAMPAVVEVLTGLLRAGGATVAMIVLPEEYRVMGIYSMFLFGSAVRGIILPRMVHKRLIPGMVIPKSSPAAAWGMIRRSGFVAVFRILRMLRNRIDVLLMGFLWISLIPEVEGDVMSARGLYGQAMRVAAIFLTFTMAFNTALFPRLSRLTGGEDAGSEKEATRNLYGRAVRWQAFWVVPLAAGIFFYVDTLCGWFGEKYVFGDPANGVLYSTADVLKVLLIAMVVDCIGGPVGMLMIGVKELERRIPWVGVTILTSSVVCNVILIPRYGILGAAYASAITAILEFVIKMWLVGGFFGNPMPILLRTLPYYALTAAMIGGLMLLDLQGNVWLGVPLAGAFYAGTCLMLKQVDPAIVGMIKRKLGKA